MFMEQQPQPHHFGRFVRFMTKLGIVGMTLTGIAGVAAYEVITHIGADVPAVTGEAVPRSETLLCFAEEPNCNDSNYLAAFRSAGNEVQLDSLDSIDPQAINALISTEDRRFFEHDGVDDPSILRALASDTKASLLDFAINFKEGASTIEMQLARTLYIKDAPSNNALRKIWEWRQAIQMDKDEIAAVKLANPNISEADAKLQAKRQILLRYFNVVNFGSHAYGIEAAAEHYFGVSAKTLGLAKSATLDAIVNEPSFFEGSKDPVQNKKAMDLLLERRNKSIYDTYENNLNPIDVVRAAQAEPLAMPAYSVAPSGESADYSRADAVGAHYLVDMVWAQYQQIAKNAGYTDYQMRDRIRVETTISRLVQTLVNNAMLQTPYKHDDRALAAVVLNQNGGIAGLYGGKYPQTDLATTPGVTGSGDKPYAYLSLIMDGTITSMDQAFPEPLSVMWPKGNDGKDWSISTGVHCPDHNSCTVRQALALSSNTFILNLMLQGGQPELDKMRSLMNAFHVTTNTPAIPSMVLGSTEATLLGRTTGMNGLVANHGLAVANYLISGFSHLENGLYVPKYDYASAVLGPNPPVQVVPQDKDAILIDGLRGPIRTGTASAVLKNFPSDAAGKTGTHDSNVVAGFYASFCGRFGNMTVGVLERDVHTLKSMGNGEDGGKVPAMAWSRIATPLADKSCNL